MISVFLFLVYLNSEKQVVNDIIIYKMSRKDKTIINIFKVLLLSLLLLGCFSCADNSRKHQYESISDLADKNIGVKVGTIYAEIISEIMPDAKILYFNNLTDQLTALKAGKIDAFPISKMVISTYLHEDEQLAIIDEPFGHIEAGYIFPKNENGLKLKNQMDEFINELDKQGTLNEIKDIWQGNDESVKNVLDYRSLNGPNGTLRFATEGTFPPNDYYRNGELIGYDVDIAYRFAQAYGYSIEPYTMDFDALIPSLESGKCDFAGSDIAITEERAESVYFSVPNLNDDLIFVVYDVDGGNSSFVDRIANSFRRTFIEENRYLYFLQGIATTILITISAIIFGTILGFAIYLLYRNSNSLIRKILDLLVWLIEGLPIVVLLMILYYVILGKTRISALSVSIIAFSLTFSCSVFGNIKTGVKAIDDKQLEAAYALGINDRQAFFDIILPQAARIFLPGYKGNISALIKATAVVGYITVQDLTKMSDIVRSRTYEAFFPLIAVAIIYFALAAIMIYIVNKITLYTDPKLRTKQQITRGIKL